MGVEGAEPGPRRVVFVAGKRLFNLMSVNSRRHLLQQLSFLHITLELRAPLDGESAEHFVK